MTPPGAVKVNGNGLDEAESLKAFNEAGLEVSDGSDVTFDLAEVACYFVKFICYYCRL